LLQLFVLFSGARQSVRKRVLVCPALEFEVFSLHVVQVVGMHRHLLQVWGSNLSVKILVCCTSVLTWKETLSLMWFWYYISICSL